MEYAQLSFIWTISDHLKIRQKLFSFQYVWSSTIKATSILKPSFAQKD